MTEEERTSAYAKQRYSTSCCAPDVAGLYIRLRNGMNDPEKKGFFWQALRCLFGKKPCGDKCCCHKETKG
jgi:hypothetical protein